MKDKKILNDFKMVMNVDLLLAQHRLVVMVLPLTKANTVIYYSNGYDLEKDYSQKTERTE